MLRQTDQASDARRLTNDLRAGCEHSPPFEKDGPIDENASTLQLVLEGGVLRQRFLSMGRTHTVAVYFRDDVINLGCYAGARGYVDDHLIALKGSVIGSVPYYAVSSICSQKDGPRDGISKLMARELGIAYERLVSLAQRSATEAMAHLFCEIYIRCAGPGGMHIDHRNLHLSQTTLSTLLGISIVHVNRALGELRRNDVADIVDQRLVVKDFKGLAALADFDDGYLAPV